MDELLILYLLHTIPVYIIKQSSATEVGTMYKGFIPTYVLFVICFHHYRSVSSVDWNSNGSSTVIYLYILCFFLIDPI